MKKKPFLTLREIVLFGLFPAVIYTSQLLMSVLPNIHLTGMLIMLMTLLFRFKALIPLYAYVVLIGLFNGFNLWWLPYLYIWTVLWAMTMLIPKKIPKKWAAIVYPAVCSLHGFLYGILYAPSQALMFEYNFQQTVLWILKGIPYDIIHGVSNLIMGTLVLPIFLALQRFTNPKTK